jgi:hypothetical protein
MRLVCPRDGRWVSLAGDSCGRVVKQAELEAATERLAEGAARWEDAYRRWEHAVDARGRVMERMDRKLLVATGGLSVTRFEAVCHRWSVRSVAEAEQKAAAIQAKATVEAAAAERDRALAEVDAAVLAARIVLAGASKVVLGYGTAGPHLVGRSPAELRRFARLPARAVNEFPSGCGPTGREAWAPK